MASRWSLSLIAVGCVGALGLGMSPAAAPVGRNTGAEFLVLYRQGVPDDAAHRAIGAAHGVMVHENRAIGLATVRSDPGFPGRARQQPLLREVAWNRTVGTAPDTGTSRTAVNRTTTGRTAEAREAPGGTGLPARTAPLAKYQWDMRQIHATGDGSQAIERGRPSVRVGVISTGIDASHPDIAKNFDRADSRDFAVDIPEDANGKTVDGPCRYEGCRAPSDVDPDGHGTALASLIAGAGTGMAGVAPDVRLVNLRAGTKSGLFLLGPTVDALTYAADRRLDIVDLNYVDPWLFNCADNPADSPEEQAQQRLDIEAMRRALDYAHHRDVTMIATAGSQYADYTKPYVDRISPYFAAFKGQNPHTRNIPAICQSLPAEGDHVMAVGATGISTRKAVYSSFGNGYITVTAPGGDAYDTADHKQDVTRSVLTAYPEAVAREHGDLNPDGTPRNPAVIRHCAHGTCGYYIFQEGTSMAAPHVVGVAALIVSRLKQQQASAGGVSPELVERLLRRTADAHACPLPATVVYVSQVKQPDGSYRRVESRQTCEGRADGNGFYGAGIVDALKAVKAVG
ncbi:subtilisin family serine protease [Streptomyces griseochromogenes]|uniref:Subtilisin family serine protease n=1 Tax=Streptomyces griseochromogenes TaxID=68214 RepID=A0ABS4MAH6_9ACTN|nr:S8 family serine peptidase [Streptomyces griseochromogenes]MBP2056681.1 subtilisin family serine protease [Streptomyces griseochromogenes]